MAQCFLQCSNLHLEVTVLADVPTKTEVGKAQLHVMKVNLVTYVIRYGIIDLSVSVMYDKSAVLDIIWEGGCNITLRVLVVKGGS